MTEIKVDITPTDLTAMRLVLAASERSRDNTPAWHRFKDLVESIEEQVKPSIEEPLAFASVVRVRSGSMFVRVGAMERHPWVSGECARSWDEMDVTEALRVGLDVAPEETENYKHGVKDTIYAIHGKVQLLRAVALTAERKDAYDNVIRAVEELQP